MNKEELKNIIDMDKRIDSKLRQLETLKDMRESISAIDYSKDNVQCSPVNQLENSVIKIIELEDEINIDIDKLVDMKDQARKYIETFENEEVKTLLTLIYIECLSYNKIAKAMKKGKKWIVDTHNRSVG